MKFSTLTFLLLAAIWLPLNAQSNPKSELVKPNQPMKTELKAYKKEHIQPVILEKRQQFDQSLSAEDKATIANLQTQIKAYKKATKKNSKMGQPQFGPTEESKKEATDDQLEGKKREGQRRFAHHGAPRGFRFFQENPEAMATATALAEKYETELTAVEADLQPHREQWKKDKEAIMEKYKSTDQPEQKHKKEGKKDGTQGNDKNKTLHQRIGFLLMPLE